MSKINLKKLADVFLCNFCPPKPLLRPEFFVCEISCKVGRPVTTFTEDSGLLQLEDLHKTMDDKVLWRE